MIGLVVTGHGHFADGIHTSAQMIAGENDYVRYINFEEGMTPEQLAEKFNAAFDEFKSCDGVVVLSDLPGGSPFKTAVECKYARPEQKIEVIAGTNLPMIVTAVTMLDMEDDPRPPPAAPRMDRISVSRCGCWTLSMRQPVRLPSSSRRTAVRKNASNGIGFLHGQDKKLVQPVELAGEI